MLQRRRRRKKKRRRRRRRDVAEADAATAVAAAAEEEEVVAAELAAALRFVRQFARPVESRRADPGQCTAGSEPITGAHDATVPVISPTDHSDSMGLWHFFVPL